MDHKQAAVVWGPHYWFFLHSAASIYPNFPNDMIKRKYYDLVSNFPVFIPNADMASRFSQMLDEFPVSPYLRNREALTRWVYFIHNKYNSIQGKDSPASFAAGQAEFLACFDRESIVARDLSDREAFAQAWSRRRRPAAVLLLLLSVLVALLWFGAGTGKSP
jgi:hypothetical protein